MTSRPNSELRSREGGAGAFRPSDDRRSHGATCSRPGFFAFCVFPLTSAPGGKNRPASFSRGRA